MMPISIHHQNLDPELLRQFTQAESDHLVPRIWQKDHSLWSKNPNEIVDRLDWLTSHQEMEKKCEEIQDFARIIAAENFDHIVVLGMGGSSLAPLLFSRQFAERRGGGELLVIDTTDADQIAATEAKFDLPRTLFVVSTKSGGTIETLSLFKYFYSRMLARYSASPNPLTQAGNHFIAITDPGSSLVKGAEQYHFRRVFLNNPNIGGRYSALTYFGLLPAALAGIEVAPLIQSAHALCPLLKNEPIAFDQNWAVALGISIGTYSQAGVDKLTLRLSPSISSFGYWLEQLVAESLGKQGRGVVPIIDEPVGAEQTWGTDRFIVSIACGEHAPISPTTRSIIMEQKIPWIELSIFQKTDVGALFLAWEFVTAAAGYALRVHPFDQPDVEEAKKRAAEFIKNRSGEEPQAVPAEYSWNAVNQFCSTLKPGDYVAIQAFGEENVANIHALHELRRRINNAYKVPTTLGFGPRYLHSTGQLHKGDAGRGRFVQLISTPRQDLEIPDDPLSGKKSSLTFQQLKLAQAMGDAAALKGKGRAVIQFLWSKQGLG
jgi:glucose-6-phosphate isomerase